MLRPMNATDDQPTTDDIVYVEVAYPEYARWTIIATMDDGWVHAREKSGQVLAFAPGQLRPLAE